MKNILYIYIYIIRRCPIYILPHYNIIYALPPPRPTGERRLQTIVCARATGSNAAARQPNDESAQYFPPSPSRDAEFDLFHVRIRRFLTSAAGTPPHEGEGLLFLFYFFPPSNPPVFFPSTRRLGSYKFTASDRHTPIIYYFYIR